MSPFAARVERVFVARFPVYKFTYALLGRMDYLDMDRNCRPPRLRVTFTRLFITSYGKIKKRVEINKKELSNKTYCLGDRFEKIPRGRSF